MPGVFAAGDVRNGSVKRVASAVGEGAIAIQEVHAFLAVSKLDRGRGADVQTRTMDLDPALTAEGDS